MDVEPMVQGREPRGVEVTSSQALDELERAYLFIDAAIGALRGFTSLNGSFDQNLDAQHVAERFLADARNCLGEQARALVPGFELPEQLNIASSSPIHLRGHHLGEAWNADSVALNLADLNARLVAVLARHGRPVPGGEASLPAALTPEFRQRRLVLFAALATALVLVLILFLKRRAHL